MRFVKPILITSYEADDPANKRHIGQGEYLKMRSEERGIKGEDRDDDWWLEARDAKQPD